MSLLTNVHAENKSERRLSVFIFNLIIFIMSFFILVVYATQPFFKVDAKAELSKENLAQLIKFEDEEIDLTQILPESVELSLTLSVEADVALDVAAKVLNQIIFNFNVDADVSEDVTALIDGNVNLLVDQILPELESIALETAKHVAIQKGKDALLEALKANSADQTQDFEQKLVDAGVTDEYIEEQMDVIIDAISAEDATLDSVANKVAETVHSIVSDKDLGLEEFEAEHEEDLKANIKEKLASFADEQGNIDMEAALAELFNKAITVVTNEEEVAQSAKSNVENNVVLLTEETTEPNGSDASAELKETLRTGILDALGEDVHKKVGEALKLASLILILAMFSWIYLMIKIIVKLFMHDNTVRFKAPIIFGALPGMLWLIPSVAMHFISKNPEVLANPYSLSLEFFASGWLAVLGVLVLIIITAPYAALRKGLKAKKLKKVK